MNDTSYFTTVSSWKQARALIVFEPLQPVRTAGLPLTALRVHVRDHKRRELAIGDRTLEAHYGRFVFTQTRKPAEEARRAALDVPYGRDPKTCEIGAHPGRVYELGPEVPPDDIDGRSSSVVVWHDADRFFLLASNSMQASDLLAIARWLYPPIRPARGSHRRETRRRSRPAKE